MILVSMERRDPTIYYATKQLYFGLVNFKFTRGGNHPPLGRRVTKKKGSGRRGLKFESKNAFAHRGLCDVHIDMIVIIHHTQHFVSTSSIFSYIQIPLSNFACFFFFFFFFLP